LIGSTLGNRYRVLREIGAGGMAKVYLAEDATGGDLVAVKVLYPQFGEDISFIQRFNREAKLASTLTDPHIVHVLDYGADRDLHYLVMEYVEGYDLNDTLQQRDRFEWPDALEVVDQLATALEHAHAHGVVHRDIKPQNMMLNDNGLLKVLDFGIARMPTLPSLTQSGFIGSPYYASPEQAMGEEVDIRSDIYSSGIVLYELLSGTIPFDAKSPWSIISQHITSEPPPIDLSDGDVPENVTVLLHRMLAKRPEERFQTPTKLREAIAAVLAGQPVPDKLEMGEQVSGIDNQALVESLTERAENSIAAGEWGRAVDLLSQATKMAPDDKQLTTRLAETEREARLSALYRSGKRAMDADKWEEAINHFNVIIELHPDYHDTPALLEKCHQFFKEENTQQFAATRYQEGLAHFETERWDSAVEAFSEVQDIMPNYEDVSFLLAEAKANQNPGVGRRFNQLVAQYGDNSVWRWAVLAVAIVVIVALAFFVFWQ
jgi:serine/threonine protein kinase